MNIIEIIAQDVFDKVRSRFANLEMGDQDGNTTSNPKDARFFDFDFTVEGASLGRVSISISDIGSLKVYYGQGITENVAQVTRDTWYDFLREMRMFAKRRMLRFDTRDITKGNLNKNDFQYLATNGTKESNMTESQYFGSTKTSYRTLENTKLIIRHSRPVNGEQPGARSRHINSLFIENSEGERFKYPLNHLAGAKAMQRHVSNGGRPYDEKGQAIINMSENIAQLNQFKKYVGRSDFVSEGVEDIVERAIAKLDQIRNECNNLCRQSYYEQWSENFQPSPAHEIDEVTLEDYKDKFTVKQFQDTLTSVFPLLHSIMQEANTVDLEDLVDEQVDEAQESEIIDPLQGFEEWSIAVTEGSIEPDTIMALKELLDQGLTLGKDAVSAIESLNAIGVHNDELENSLLELASKDPNADPSPTIMAWLQKEDPEAAQELMGSEAPDMAQPAAAPEPMAQQPAPAMAEDDEEEQQHNLEPAPQPAMNTREIAEVVLSFYDREHGTFPKGETGVITHIKKRFGDRAGMMAERLVSELSPQVNSQMENQELDQILKYAGLGENVDKSKIPAYKRKEKGGDWKVSTKDLEDEKTKSPTSSAGLARKKKELGIDEVSDQAKTTMKHIKNPTKGEKQAAKDIKPGIAGYRDRIDMLQSAKAAGRLKEK